MFAAGNKIDLSTDEISGSENLTIEIVQENLGDCN